MSLKWCIIQFKSIISQGAHIFPSPKIKKRCLFFLFLRCFAFFSPSKILGQGIVILSFSLGLSFSLSLLFSW